MAAGQGVARGGDPWPGVELRHLEALRAVAEETSFRRAAIRLGYGQSAISQQIALLERRVGARLVDRLPGGKTVSLTSAGGLLLRHAEEILDRVTLARRDFAVLAGELEASVGLGVCQSIGARLLAPTLARAARVRRDLRVRAVEARRPSELLDLLAEGRVDLAFTEEPPADERLLSLTLLPDPYALLARADDRRILATRVSIDRLASLPLLTYETCFHLCRVEEELTREGVVLDAIVRSDDARTLHDLVAAGVGYALLPRLAVDPDDARVVALPVDTRIRPRLVCLAWRSERNLTRAMKTIVTAAKHVANGINAASRSH